MTRRLIGLHITLTLGFPEAPLGSGSSTSIHP
jgi:hypothetical protein